MSPGPAYILSPASFPGVPTVSDMVLWSLLGFGEVFLTTTLPLPPDLVNFLVLYFLSGPIYCPWLLVLRGPYGFCHRPHFTVESHYVGRQPLWHIGLRSAEAVLLWAHALSPIAQHRTDAQQILPRGM